MVGLLVALLGVFFAHQLNDPKFDGIASIIIGTLLALVALVLIYDEGVEPSVLEKLRALVRSQPGVQEVRRMLTMYFGPHTILLTMELQFADGLSTRDIETTVDRLEREIRSARSDIKHIFIEVESFKGERNAPGQATRTSSKSKGQS
jgi:divalent metal cation (Fe/Co/Zn/Cd) transporter